MTLTIILIVSCVAITIGTFALQIYSVKWGLRHAGLANVSALKAFLYLMLFAVSAAVIGLIAEVVIARWARQPSEIEGTLLVILLQPIVATFVFAKVYKAKLLRAVQATIPLIVAAFGPILIAIFLVRPFLYEAFSAPTNSMAPTLLGHHWTGKCPRCGHPAYGSVSDQQGRTAFREVPMICSNDLQSCLINNPNTEIGEADRFLVSKLATPRRWDIIVFRLPEDPSYFYVKRLVGLPGEELFIRDGHVWINGKKLDPPKSLEGIEYLATLEHAPFPSWAEESNPAQLGPGEYFVLGDFSAQASDSRFWQKGAPGHPPFAVPEDYIVGVVTHIYWPPERWRAFQ